MFTDPPVVFLLYDLPNKDLKFKSLYVILSSEDASYPGLCEDYEEHSLQCTCIRGNILYRAMCCALLSGSRALYYDTAEALS